ncbi:Leucine Rich repeat, putative [Trypanosoma equiperdum]|uniref:Leucine Rich repeat, putative n=1 Tax=Trypanosoma equiperdum TaxID=5694 RepID=A0A1G4IE82_TRYEQ|nr:Leucine Rich repeat, putative [Trypanosoma equiperdum]
MTQPDIFMGGNPLCVRYNGYPIHVVRSTDGTSWFSAADIVRALSMYSTGMGAGDCCKDDNTLSPSDESADFAKRLLFSVDEEHKKPLKDVVKECERALYGSAGMEALYVDLTGIQTLTRATSMPTEADYNDFMQHGEALNKIVGVLQRGIRDSCAQMSEKPWNDGSGGVVEVNAADLQSLLKTVEEMNGYMCSILPRVANNEATIRTVSEHMLQLQNKVDHEIEKIRREFSQHGTASLTGRDKVSENAESEPPCGTAELNISESPTAACKTVRLLDQSKNGAWQRQEHPVDIISSEERLMNSFNFEACGASAEEFGEAELELIAYFRRALSRLGQQGRTCIKLFPVKDSNKHSSHSAERATYELKVKRMSLQLSDFKFISMCPSIAKLRFSECRGVCDLEVLAEAKSLDALSLDIEGEVRHLHFLSGLPSLKTLQLHYQQISDDEFRCLCLLEGLEELTLRDAWNLTCLAPIASLRRLRALDLSLPLVAPSGCVQEECSSDGDQSADTKYPHLTDVSPLAEIIALEDLNLQGRGGVEAGVDALGSLPKLRVLNLSGTGITDLCFGGLSESKTLTSLDISFCWNLTDLSQLAQVATLKELKLRLHKDGVPCVDGLDSLPLRTLHLVLPQRICQHSEESSTLESSCEVAPTVSLTDVFPLEGIETLEELSLRGQGHLSLQMDVLSSLPHLCVLDLSFISMTEQCLDVLATIPGLVKLGFTARGCTGNMSSLSKITSLEELDVRSCSSAGAIVDAAALLPKLRVFSLSGATITPRSLQSLIQCNNLVKLDISFCRNVEGGTPFPLMTTVEELNLKGCQSVLCLGVLANFPSLRKLNVKNMYVSSEVLKEFRGRNVVVRYRC